MRLVIPDQNEQAEVIIHKRKDDPKISCQLLHRLMYTEITNLEVTNKFNHQSPVQYYAELKKNMTNIVG